MEVETPAKKVKDLYQKLRVSSRLTYGTEKEKGRGWTDIGSICLGVLQRASLSCHDPKDVDVQYFAGKISSLDLARLIWLLCVKKAGESGHKEIPLSLNLCQDSGSARLVFYSFDLVRFEASFWTADLAPR